MRTQFDIIAAHRPFGRRRVLPVFVVDVVREPRERDPERMDRHAKRRYI
jgi:hypothetical protein